MLTLKFDRPQVAHRDVVAMVRERYGLRVSARSLPSERDQNFHLVAEDGRQFVLKIANAGEERAVLDLQNRAMDHLGVLAPALLVPRVEHTRDGEAMTSIEGSAGTLHTVRLLTYVPGRVFAQVRPHTGELLESLGRAIGSVTRALKDFAHPAARRELKWDLARAGWIRGCFGCIADPPRRALVERVLEEFDSRAVPAWDCLRAGVIYNDANDYNVLVDGEDARRRRVVGVIDFGDMVHSAVVGDLAVAVAYAVLDAADPLAAAAHVVTGYAAVLPPTDDEVELLHLLVCTRLAVSVTNSAYQRAADPANEYLTISERPAWNALERLADVHPRLAHYTFRDACGRAACPQTAPAVRWLTSHAAEFGPLTDPDSRTAPRVVFDLSAGSAELDRPQVWSDAAAFTHALFDRMRDAGASVGIGRYDETRPFYTSEGFRTLGLDGPEWRTVHLGLDVFMEPGTPILAPLDGIVHSFADNAAPLDYGPTIILEHRAREDSEGGELVHGRQEDPAGGRVPVFYTLYGHLSPDSLDGLVTGARVRKGDVLGRIGTFPRNGGWVPHLHFQISTDLLERRGDFPGVARPRDRGVWLSLSPDPNLLARIPDLALAARVEPDQVLARRRRHLSRSLSLSYDRPLALVRGYLQYLYDEEGRRYLDAVNNVAHVGHCHPRIVEAGQRQMAVLNTNTRYLHERIVQYAERLCATLPEPLQVCFFVCSGSEANELALRLARAHLRSRETIVVDVAYHGNTTGLIEISPYKFNGPGGVGAPVFVHTTPLPDLYRGEYRGDDPGAGAKYAAHVGEAVERIRAQVHARPTFICESLPSCAGQIVLPEGYLGHAYRHVRAAGGVCIADEVQVGFGRVGTHFWGFQTQGVIPDIVTMGKPMGNGHPLGAVVTTRDIAASFETGMEYFNTFGGNPVSCAIGLAVLDVIEQGRLQENALGVGTRLIDGLRRLMGRHPIIGDVRGSGFYAGVELVRDRGTREPAPREAAYAINRLRDRGVLTSTDGPFHNVIKIRPPMVFTEADADTVVETLDIVLAEI